MSPHFQLIFNSLHWKRIIFTLPNRPWTHELLPHHSRLMLKPWVHHVTLLSSLITQDKHNFSYNSLSRTQRCPWSIAQAFKGDIRHIQFVTERDRNSQAPQGSLWNILEAAHGDHHNYLQCTDNYVLSSLTRQQYGPLTTPRPTSTNYITAERNGMPQNEFDIHLHTETSPLPLWKSLYLMFEQNLVCALFRPPHPTQ